MKATWRMPVRELRLQMLPSDKLELSESLLVRSVRDVGLGLHDAQGVSRFTEVNLSLSIFEGLPVRVLMLQVLPLGKQGLSKSLLVNPMRDNGPNMRIFPECSTINDQ